MVKWNIFFISFAFAFLYQCDGFSSGAGSSACGTMIPGHGVLPQTVPSLYLISTDVNSYSHTAKDTVAVELYGSADFMGFLVMARSASHGTNPVGTFASHTEGQNLCAKGTRLGAAFTHKNSNVKNNLTFLWTPPSTNVGNVTFYATFVKQGIVFWVEQNSSLVTEVGMSSSAPVLPTSSNTVTSISMAPPTRAPVSGCGISKGCFSVPKTGVTAVWTPNSTASEVTFDLSGTTTGYIAFGLSLNAKMNDDSVITCYRDPATGTVKVQYGFTTPPTSPKSFIPLGSHPELKLLSSSYISGVLECSVSRPVISNTSLAHPVYPLDKSYYLLLASGAGFFKFHGVTDCAVSAEAMSVLSVSKVESNSNNTFIKIHGIMMILGWMVCASIGVTMPAFFKNGWPTKKPGGKALWFVIHQALMISNLLLTSCAFILIFVDVGGYTTPIDWRSTSHPIIGIVVTALCFINPFMALFRCAPGHPKRWIFNKAHTTVGYSAIILSAVNIAFGSSFEAASSDFNWLPYIVLVWFLCIVFVKIIMHWSTKNKRKIFANKNNNYNLDTDANSGDAKLSAPPYSFLCLFVALCLIFAFTIVIPLIIH